MNEAILEDIKPTPEQERLSPWFSLVANPADWKAPIRAYIRADKKDLVREAIVFYTATAPTFMDLGDGWLRVDSIGYRRGPAGDH